MSDGQDSPPASQPNLPFNPQTISQPLTSPTTAPTPNEHKTHLPNGQNTPKQCQHLQLQPLAGCINIRSTRTRQRRRCQSSTSSEGSSTRRRSCCCIDSHRYCHCFHRCYANLDENHASVRHSNAQFLDGSGFERRSRGDIATGEKSGK